MDGLWLTERFRRKTVGRLQVETTFDERALYSRPWTITTQGTLVADTDLLEYVCETHTKGARLIGRASDGIDPRSVAKIPDAMLARYAGTYEYHLPENATALRTMLVTVRDGQLLIDGNRPLIPQSETRFVLRGARQIEFLTDANGEVEGIRVQRTAGCGGSSGFAVSLVCGETAGELRATRQRPVR
jgi:hypothetical protein